MYFRCVVLQDCPSLEPVVGPSVVGLNDNGANVTFTMSMTAKSFRITITQDSNPSARGELTEPNDNTSPTPKNKTISFNRLLPGKLFALGNIS